MTPFLEAVGSGPSDLLDAQKLLFSLLLQEFSIPASRYCFMVVESDL